MSKKPEPAAPRQPVVQSPSPPERVIRFQDPLHNLVLAAFTPRELETLRSVCRDSDNETATRVLNAALARAGK